MDSATAQKAQCMGINCWREWAAITIRADGATRLCFPCWLRQRAGEELTKRRVREPLLGNGHA